MSPLHQRLHTIAGKLTYRALGEALQEHPENVRRYMQGQSPSAEFLAAICAHFALCAQWLLTGRGPMRASEERAHALRESDPSELLDAVAAGLEKLSDRVDRIESFVHALESRLYGAGGAPATNANEREGTPAHRGADPAANG